MANSENLAILEQGVEIWNQWRDKYKYVKPNLNRANLEGANLEVANLEGAKLYRANLEGANLNRAILEGAKLNEAILTGAKLNGANLNRAILQRAKLNEAILQRAKLNEANLNRAILNRANLNEANLNGANLNEANLTGAILTGVNFTGANLAGANLAGANLAGANLAGANLTGAKLNRAKLNRANLEGANLTGAILNRAILNRTNLAGANLEGAILAEAILTGAILTGAILTGAILTGANLTGANLTGAILTGANLTGANLTGAILTGANLTGANLTGANLNRAILNKAILTGAILTGAILTGAILTGAILTEAILNGANLNGVKLNGANLEGAILVQIQALATKFTSANLTGSCIQDWNINSDTDFTNVLCEYIYFKENQQERRPSDPAKNFAPGEFIQLVEKSLETVDLIFVDGIDWKAFLESFNELKAKYGENNIEVQAIEKKSGGAFVIRLEVPPGGNKAEIESQIKELYEIKLNALETIYHEKLQAKDEQIVEIRFHNTNLLNIINTLANRPVQNSISVITNSHSEIMSESYQSKYDQRNAHNQFVDTAESGSNIKFHQNNYTSEQKQNLAEAAAEIQKLLQQLENTNPSATESEQIDYIKDNTTPNFQRRAASALKAGGETAIDEFILENKYLKVTKAIIKGWLQPNS